jgi:phage N-6-adenine-methyltransferase
MKVHFTSAKTGTGKDNWETPDYVFNWVVERYGMPVLDVCASHENTKCMEYYTEEQDGLQKPWVGDVWCNPPYSDLLLWVKKAIFETEMTEKCKNVTMLIPARTDTKAFGLIWQHAVEVIFITGRLRFVGSKSSAPFPSMLVRFSGQKTSDEVGPFVSLASIKEQK